MINTEALSVPALFQMVKPLIRQQPKQEQFYNYNGLKLSVSPGVVHPGQIKSTGIMISYLEQLNLSCKSILEIGCGCGIVSIAAAKQNAAVTAIDINPKAVRNTAENAILNGVVVKALQSDLFEKVSAGYYNFIVVNLPVLTESVSDKKQKGLTCGKIDDFLKQFFNNAKNYTGSSSKIFMALEVGAQGQLVLDLAKKAGFTGQEIYTKPNFWESNSVWQFQKT